MWKKLIKNRISLLSAVLLVTALCAVPVCYGWFTSPRQNISMDQTGGEFRAQYFHSGNGTEESPYVITRPIHFYNMVNLYQRVSDYSEQEYYFQIGANDIEGHTDGYYVYAYNDDGEIATDENGDFIYTHELNLACYTKAGEEGNDNSLAPIGTYDKNFLGTFDGKGNTVSGFTVSVSGLANKTECDIGIFGFVGEGASIKDVYFEDVTIDLTGLSNVVSASTGTQAHNHKVHTVNGQTVAYAGYLAGHIAATSSCQRVYLNDVTMTGGGAAVSSFGYFGCVENDDGSSVQTLGQSITTQWASGDSAGWGGSLDMKNMFNRLMNVRSDSTSFFEYPSAETIVLEEDTQKVVSRDVTATASGTSDHEGNLLNFRLYQSALGGTYYFNTYSNSSYYIYLSGLNEFQLKTLSTYTASDTEEEAIYICDPDAGNFLSVGADYEIINITSRDNASKWITEDTDESGGGMKYLYTRIGVRPYYLNASGTSLVLSAEKDSQWMIAQDPDGLYQVIFTTSASGNSYYLKFEDAWQLATNETTYAVGDGDGHYLNSDGSSISMQTAAGTATAWKIVVNGGQTSFSVTDGNTEKYLAYESGTGLKLSATPFTWNQELVSAAEMKYRYSYTDSTENITWYLAYENGWKAVRLTGKTISYRAAAEEDPFYLKADSSMNSVISSASTGYAACWQMDTEASATGIRVDYNGKHYYLGADFATGDLTLEEYAFGDTDIPVWVRDTDEGKYYITSGGTSYYLTYKNGWRVEAGTKYSIWYEDEAEGTVHYFGMDQSLPGQVDDPEQEHGEYTGFTIEDLDGEGLMYVTVEGENWYLTAERNTAGQLLLKFMCENDTWGPENALRWKRDSSGFYTTIKENGLDKQYYLYYYYDEWCLRQLYYTFYSDRERYLAWTYLGTVIADTDPGNVAWLCNGKNIWASINNVDYFLAFSAENEVPVLVQASAETEPFEWEIDEEEASISATVNGVKYNLRVVNGSWITMRSDLSSICYEENRLKFAYTAAGPELRNTAVEEIASFWRIYESGTAVSGNGSPYAISYTADVNGTPTEYFLNADAVGELSLDTTQATVWYREEDSMYCLSSEDRLYLSYQEEDDEVWRARAYAYVLFENDGLYMMLEGEEGETPVLCDTADDELAAKWWVSSDEEPTNIFTVYNGVHYYLNTASDGTLSVSGTAQIWNRDGEGYYVTEGQYLTYDASNGRGWCCLTLEGYSCITDSLDNYLCYTINRKTGIGSFENMDDPADATKWEISDGNADESVIISALIGTNTFYLSQSEGSLAMSTAPADWFTGYGTYYLKNDGDTERYYLVCEYDEDEDDWFWSLNSSPTSYYIFTEDSDGEKYYLAKKSSTSTTLTALSEVTAKKYLQFKWTFESFNGYAPNGKITILNKGSTYYLRDSVSSNTVALSTKSSNSNYRYLWNYDNYLYTTDSSSYVYGLKYESSWKTVKHDGGATGSPITLNVYGCAGSVDYTYAAVAPDPEYTNQAGLESSSDHTVTREGYTREICTEYSGAPTSVQRIELGDITLPAPSVWWSERSGDHSLRTLVSSAEEYTQVAGSPKTVKGGYETCIPLRVELQDEEDETSWYSDYRVSSENTGYIIGGANQTSPEGKTYRSDVRVSQYKTKDIYKAINSNSYQSPQYDSYDSKLQVLTRTAASEAETETAGLTGKNRYVRIRDTHNAESINEYYDNEENGLPAKNMTVAELGLTKYEAEGVELSRDAFCGMLSGSNLIYGLHFMESSIPDIYGTESEVELSELRERIIYADQATILGKTYQYYELPEDCIDFKVAERGAVSIFAGTFYTYETTSFFSLHHIKRDSNQHIETIKEIRRIYKKTGSDTAAYVYEYGDGSCSIPGTDLTSYEMIFDMSWVTNFDLDGSQLTDLVQNAVYYFEIPVNSGEYALGSVENGIGAYLMYLDIGTNGGGAIENKISVAGSGVSSLFKVEYRSSGMTDLFPTDGSLANSLLQFSINAPEANASDYSVHIEFIKEENPTAEELADHPGGLYVITVNNRTAGDIELTVFVCDNDSIEGNDYPYSYKIMYTDKSQTTPAVYPSATLWYKTSTRFAIGNGDS